VTLLTEGSWRPGGPGRHPGRRTAAALADETAIVSQALTAAAVTAQAARDMKSPRALIWR
jgi:hypothetical protein